MNKKYTHIFFDLDNTLWDFDKNSRNAMFIAFCRFKLDLVSNFDLFFETYTRHNHALWESYRNKEVVKKDLTRLRFENTFKELEITGINADEMNTIYLTEMPGQKELNDGAINILDYLKKKRYHLNIITNGFKEVQHKKIETSGLKPYFDKIFISEEIKSPKPERRIFEYSIKSVNAKKIYSIMIGDDLNVDVLGAAKYGIDAILYQKNSEAEISTVDNPLNKGSKIYKIGAFNQLKEIL
ncbi:MAG TPA: YjjG family noncanonical pyrimidine nucleotidase [Draconibacterium sp.]|nr:YjjG family noncanonical pyrimidine nucleotidase [Draconibacterium sp.]